MEDHSIKRFSRLTAILTRLQTRSLVTATDLSEKFGVSVRTIYRDIRALEVSGVPIVTVDEKGYSLVEDHLHVLNRLVLACLNVSQSINYLAPLGAERRGGWLAPNICWATRSGKPKTGGEKKKLAKYGRKPGGDEAAGKGG